MKFGRYLAENQTAEWKRAYIDYRACKKKIRVIENRLKQIDGREEEKESSDADDDHGPSAPPLRSASIRTASSGKPSSQHDRNPEVNPSRTPSRRSDATPRHGATGSSPRPIHRSELNPPPLDLGESSYESTRKLPESLPREEGRLRKDVSFSPIVKARSPDSPEGSVKRSSDDPSTSESGQPLNPSGSKITKSPRFKSPRFLSSPKLNSPKPSTQTPSRRSLRTMTLPSPRVAPRTPPTFDELYLDLQNDEKDFFDLLQHELDKVEGFYHAREMEAVRRAHDLRDQLRELAEHRRIFHELYPNGLGDWEAAVGRILPTAAPATGLAKALNQLRVPFGNDEPPANGDAPAMDRETEGRLRAAMTADKDHQTYSPERYQKYKKELKAAVMDFYRQLELIKNYRILNLTGFRKALKKFEKRTKIHCLELYTDEKISPESFAKGETVEKLIKQTEALYTEHFEHGDFKKARDKLRRQFQESTHYRSMFRSGIMIGLGSPAVVFGIVLACQDETHFAIPAWGALLQVYGALFLPVIFAMLFELNLDAYVQARINYEFVMELSRPTLDYRAYLELPAFLFMTLSYCFFFSFYRVGASNVDPTTWPAVWLIFLLVFWLNPLPIFRRQARYWLLRVLFRVCTPGYSRVEFIAFFLADELNSLIYTMQNLYFIGCAYGHHWAGDVYTVCPSGKQWPYALFLCLPALSRLIQCLKRWYDSKLGIHLINAGKYLSTISQLCLFVLWRSRGSEFHDASFIVWVIIATISATYSCTWDLVVDWSLFRPNSRFLRQDLGYGNSLVYYFAIVTNTLVRFVFIWYLPYSARHTRLRSFFFALAEMLRRWQWNFFRVETEHLGNADAYRVTREIPLPYRRVDHDDDDQDEDFGSQPTPHKLNSLSVRLEHIRRGLVGTADGRGPDALNLGARGYANQREYEARRPGDLRRRNTDVTNNGEV